MPAIFHRSYAIGQPYQRVHVNIVRPGLLFTKENRPGRRRNGAFRNSKWIGMPEEIRPQRISKRTPKVIIKPVNKVASRRILWIGRKARAKRVTGHRVTGAFQEPEVH